VPYDAGTLTVYASSDTTTVTISTSSVSTSNGHKDISTDSFYSKVSQSLEDFNTFTNDELQDINNFVMAQYSSITDFLDFEDITDTLTKFYYDAKDSPFLGVGKYLALSRFKPIKKLIKPFEFVYDTFIKKSNDENYIQYKIKQSSDDFLLRDIADSLLDIVDSINPIVDIEKNQNGDLVAFRSDGFEMQKDGDTLIATLGLNALGLLGFGNTVKNIEDDILNNPISITEPNVSDSINQIDTLNNVVLTKYDDVTTISIPSSKFELTTSPSSTITTTNKKDLMDYGEATSKAIVKRESDVAVAKSPYDAAVYALNRYVNKKAGNTSVRTSVRQKYEQKVNATIPNLNAKIENLNNQNKNKTNNVLSLLDQLVKTCLSASEIMQIVNDTFGDVLTLDAHEIIQEHLDRNKIYTECCLKLQCKPCQYTNVKYYDDASGKGN